MDTTQANQLFDYDVVDSAGNKVGSVDNVWVDDATNEPEFIGVKTGWLLGKTHLIPVQDAQIADGSSTVTVPYTDDQIKNAPTFAGDAELSPDDESQIYSYYGMDRSTAPSPTGLGTDTGTADAGPTEYQQTDTGYTGQTGTVTDQENLNVPVSEEELQVGTREVEAGQVRLRKVVRTEQQEVPVELRREEVDIERIPASGTEVPTDAFQEREITVPVRREEPVVGKEARVTGQVQVGKTVQTETQTVGDQVRREEVEVDDNSTDFANRTGQDT